MATYYELLGVSKSCTEHDLKKAFRILAMKHHPDKNPGSKTAEETFKNINNAYHILIDVSKRQAYDISITPNRYPQTQYGSEDLDAFLRKYQQDIARRQAETDEHIRQMHERIQRNMDEAIRRAEELRKPSYNWEAPKKGPKKPTSKPAPKAKKFEMANLIFTLVMMMILSFSIIATFAAGDYFITFLCVIADVMFGFNLKGYLDNV